MCRLHTDDCGLKAAASLRMIGDVSIIAITAIQTVTTALRCSFCKLLCLIMTSVWSKYLNSAASQADNQCLDAESMTQPIAARDVIGVR